MPTILAFGGGGSGMKFISAAPVQVQSTSAYIINGPTFNKKIKALSGCDVSNYDISTLDSIMNTLPIDESINRIVQSMDPPEITIANGSDGDISRDQDGSIVAWYNENQRILYWYTEATSIVLPSNAAVMFAGFIYLQSDGLNNMLHYFNTSAVTNMAGMFGALPNLTTIDLSSFNTSNVTNMNFLFASENNLTTIYVSNLWSTANVVDDIQMFSDSSNLVGGAGTVFDSNHIDSAYAHIDAQNDPGYLTYKAPTSIIRTLNEPSGYTAAKYKDGSWAWWNTSNNRLYFYTGGQWRAVNTYQ